MKVSLRVLALVALSACKTVHGQRMQPVDGLTSHVVEVDGGHAELEDAAWKKINLTETYAHLLARQGRFSADDIFQIDYSRSERGGCGYVGKQVLDNMVFDLVDLIVSGRQFAIDAKAGSPVATRLGRAFLGYLDREDVSEADLNRAGTIYMEMLNFLSKQGAYDLGGASRTNKPILACNSDWIEEHSWDGPAPDSRGNTVWDPFNQRYRTFEEFHYYRQEKDRIEQQAGVEVVPYWSHLHRRIFFLPSKVLGPGCLGNTNGQTTFGNFDPLVLTLCPKVFGIDEKALDPNNPPRGTIHRRLEKKARPVLQNSLMSHPPGQQTLTELMTATTTFLHELMHLVIGQRQSTQPDSSEIYPLFDCIGLEPEKALRNPESMLYIALAYDYTTNIPPNSAGDRVEFFSGLATVLRP